MPSQGYPFVNIVESEDKSVTVNGGGGKLDLQIKLKVNENIADIFAFISGGEENPGRHSLTVKAGKAGIIVASGGKLTCLDYPESPSVLVMKSGSPGWESAPASGKCLLGLKGGSIHWYRMEDCEHACDSDTEE